MVRLLEGEGEDRLCGPVLGMDSVTEDGLQASPHPAQHRPCPVPTLLPGPVSSAASLYHTACLLCSPSPLTFLTLLSLHFVQTVSTREQGRPKFPLQLHLIPRQSKGTFVGRAPGPRSVSAETDVSRFPHRDAQTPSQFAVHI